MRNAAFIMSNRSLNGRALLAALTLLAAPRPALALQPLEEFVGAAQGKNLDNREAQATADQRVDESRQAWSRIGPNITAKASYQRNQFEAAPSFPGCPQGTATCAPSAMVAKTVTITPYDQLDAFFTINLPLVDVGSWKRIGASDATAEAAKVRAAATGLDVEKSVVARVLPGGRGRGDARGGARRRSRRRRRARRSWARGARRGRPRTSIRSGRMRTWSGRGRWW